MAESAKSSKFLYRIYGGISKSYALNEVRKAREILTWYAVPLSSPAMAYSLLLPSVVTT